MRKLLFQNFLLRQYLQRQTIAIVFEFDPHFLIRKRPLKPTRWKDGKTTFDQPRRLYGLTNNALLVSRVYGCDKDIKLSRMTQLFCPKYRVCFKSFLYILWSFSCFLVPNCQPVFNFSVSGLSKTVFIFFFPDQLKVYFGRLLCSFLGFSSVEIKSGDGYQSYGEYPLITIRQFASSDQFHPIRAHRN